MRVKAWISTTWLPRGYVQNFIVSFFFPSTWRFFLTWIEGLRTQGVFHCRDCKAHWGNVIVMLGYINKIAWIWFENSVQLSVKGALLSQNNPKNTSLNVSPICTKINENVYHDQMGKKIVPSIHSFIFFCLSGAGSRGQLSEQGHPDFPHTRNFL